MRKLILTILLTGLLLSLALTGYAAQTDAQLSDAAAQPGDTVYLTMRLPDGVAGDAVGITYTYDQALLERLPASSSWCIKAVLKDFSTQRSEGVWAAADPVALNGDLCVLAFRVKEGVKLNETQVTCTAIVKNGDSQVGTYTAAATISAQCDHSYGGWKTGGTAGHIRQCEKCGRQQTASHQWGQTKETTDPKDSTVTIRTTTCSVCGEAKEERIQSDIHVVTPTYPASTVPEETVPELTIPEEEPPKPYIPTKPEEKEEEVKKPDSTRPTTGKNNTSGGSSDKDNTDKDEHRGTIKENTDQPRDYNQPEETKATTPAGNIIAADDHSHEHTDRQEAEHDHADEILETHPLILPAGPVDSDSAVETAPVTAEDAHDHEHDHTHETTQTQPLSVIAGVATVAVLGAALAFFLRKKRR